MHELELQQTVEATSTRSYYDIYVYIYIYIYVCTYIHTHYCIYTCIHIYIYILFAHVIVHIYMCMCIYIYICKHSCIFIHLRPQATKPRLRWRGFCCRCASGLLWPWPPGWTRTSCDLAGPNMALTCPNMAPTEDIM